MANQEINYSSTIRIPHSQICNLVTPTDFRKGERPLEPPQGAAQTWSTGPSYKDRHGSDVEAGLPVLATRILLAR